MKKKAKGEPAKKDRRPRMMDISLDQLQEYEANLERQMNALRAYRLLIERAGHSQIATEGTGKMEDGLESIYAFLGHLSKGMAKEKIFVDKEQTD